MMLVRAPLVSKGVASSQMPTLIRTLRLRDLLFLFIGSVIGSGIFLSPGLILRQVNGSVGLSMLVWVAGGVMSLLVPAKMLNSGYAAPLRRHAASSANIVALDDWSSDAKRHFDADTFPLGITLAHRNNAAA